MYVWGKALVAYESSGNLIMNMKSSLSSLGRNHQCLYIPIKKAH